MEDRTEDPGVGGVPASWSRIEAWLNSHAPAIAASLRPGATEDQLQVAAQVVDTALPADVVESYRTHDGQADGPPLLEDWTLMPLDIMVAKWSTLKGFLEEGVIGADEGEPIGPIRAEWWRPEWIPVAHNSSGDYCCIDLAPEPGGNLGQVISYWHADPRREVLAQNFATWLRHFADDLVAGRYRVDDDWLERVDPRSDTDAGG